MPLRAPWLACIRPAASVHPEPGSNSPSCILCQSPSQGINLYFLKHAGIFSRTRLQRNLSIPSLLILTSLTAYLLPSCQWTLFSPDLRFFKPTSKSGMQRYEQNCQTCKNYFQFFFNISFTSLSTPLSYLFCVYLFFKAGAKVRAFFILSSIWQKIFYFFFTTCQNDWSNKKQIRRFHKIKCGKRRVVGLKQVVRQGFGKEKIFFNPAM